MDELLRNWTNYMTSMYPMGLGDKYKRITKSLTAIKDFTDKELLHYVTKETLKYGSTYMRKIEPGTALYNTLYSRKDDNPLGLSLITSQKEKGKKKQVHLDTGQLYDGQLPRGIKEGFISCAIKPFTFTKTYMFRTWTGPGVYGELFISGSESVRTLIGMVLDSCYCELLHAFRGDAVVICGNKIFGDQEHARQLLYDIGNLYPEMQYSENDEETVENLDSEKMPWIVNHLGNHCYHALFLADVFYSLSTESYFVTGKTKNTLATPRCLFCKERSRYACYGMSSAPIMRFFMCRRCYKRAVDLSVTFIRVVDMIGG